MSSSESDSNFLQGIDGVLYTRVIDPYKAAYNIEAPLYAVSQLAQT
jgi:regulator of protease activity HflC (stomatin/prohibitin superfamily)